VIEIEAAGDPEIRGREVAKPQGIARACSSTGVALAVSSSTCVVRQPER